MHPLGFRVFFLSSSRYALSLVFYLFQTFWFVVVLFCTSYLLEVDVTKLNVRCLCLEVSQLCIEGSQIKCYTTVQ